jgi:hypothetical protein
MDTTDSPDAADMYLEYVSDFGENITVCAHTARMTNTRQARANQPAPPEAGAAFRRSMAENM